MKKMLLTLTLAIGLAGAGGALAQPVPLPFDNVGGAPVAAHYVKLEGSGPEIVRDGLKDMQASCLRFSGIQVDLPPDSELVIKITREEYYTATHLIVYRRVKAFQITPDCGSIWVEHDPEIVITHDGGVCTINVKKRTAIGYGCDPAAGGRPGRMTKDANLPFENLGKDGALDCVRTAVQAGGMRMVRCVRPRPEPWLSFKYSSVKPSRQGIVMEDKALSLSSGKVVEDLKAVDVRENITVGSDMLDLARTQGLTLIGAPKARRSR